MTLWSEYELPSSTCLEQFQKFGQIELGNYPQSTLKENFCMRTEFLTIATCASNLTFLAPFISEIQTVSQNWGPKIVMTGYPIGSKMVPLDSTGVLSYWSLTVLEAVLHRFPFPRCSLRHVQHRYIWTGSPGTISVKFCVVFGGWLVSK